MDRSRAWANTSRESVIGVHRAGGIPVGIFPNEGAIVRLIGAVLMECNDEWAVQTRYVQVEPIAELLAPADAEPMQITADAA